MYKSLMFVRFALSDRIGHWILAIAFLVLALTGFSQMVPLNPISLWIMNGFGGVGNIRIVHHILGFIFFVLMLYSIGAVTYRAFIRRISIKAVPDFADIRDIFQSYKYNFNLTNERPSTGRVELTGKVLLWALIWGSAIMVISGFIILNPIAATTLLPGIVIPMAKTAHGYEAILVVLALAIWHLYFLLMKQLAFLINKKFPEARKSHRFDHPFETVDWFDKRETVPVTQQAIETYWRYYLPGYLLVSGFIMMGAIYFVNFEKTSILTLINPEDVNVYAPEAMLASADLSTMPDVIPEHLVGPYSVDTIHSWNSCMNTTVLTQCTNCHETENVIGVNLDTYSRLVESGLVMPGEPDKSPFLEIVSDPDHVGRNVNGLYAVYYDWIASGAPESSYPAGLREKYSNLTWKKDILPIMTRNCIECHCSSNYGYTDFRTYYSTLDSDSIKFACPDESKMLNVIEGGGHPGLLSADELLIMHEWIRTGARSGMTPDEATDEYRAVHLGECASKEIEPPAEDISTSEESAASPDMKSVWDSSIGAIFQAGCTGCHGAGAMGGLNLSSYESVMASGVIVPGDPAKSLLVTKMESGSHPLLLSAADLDSVKNWIANGS